MLLFLKCKSQVVATVAFCTPSRVFFVERDVRYDGSGQNYIMTSRDGLRCVRFVIFATSSVILVLLYYA